MGYTKYNYNKRFFQNIDTEEKAYWLGFIAADGNVASAMNTSRIELNIRDKNHLVKFRESILGDMPIKENIRKKNHSCYIDVNSKEYCKDLYNIGVTPKKSLTLDIDFSKIPDELIHHFVRGYFDGDGSINVYERAPYYYKEWEVSFISTKIMLLHFQDFFGKPKKIFTCGKNFRMCYKSKKDIEEVLEYMYRDATIYLERKYEKAKIFLMPPETTKGQL